ncbi:PPE domain-containing protein [Nocardia sp. NPDC050697]|uniref:PPE domain-containing protein n=1 Tax=Nocardia sp. NPDC050697 TaxID=3155158 RepID=UPI0033FF0221
MIEPPQPGFTGVVWEAREPDRLARELTTGAGAVPLAEAGAAWASLAATFGAAVLEYEQIVQRMRGAWQSGTSRAVLDRVATLRDWLIDASAAAGSNALRAQTQAAAHELARLTMPNAADIAAIAEVERTLEQMTAAMGAPIRAIAAQTDEDADVAKAAASRVMRTYEAATEPLAVPWLQQQPPVLASPAALAAEQGGAPQPAPSTPVAPIAAPGFGGFGGVGIAPVPRVKTAYQARLPIETGSTSTETLETVVAQPGQGSQGGVPLVPGALGGAAAAQSAEEEYQARVAEVSADLIGQDIGIVSAPAVLGAPEPPPAAGPAVAGGAA